MYKMFTINFFMFLDLKVSCVQNKNQSLGKTDFEKGPPKISMIDC